VVHISIRTDLEVKFVGSLEPIRELCGGLFFFEVLWLDHSCISALFMIEEESSKHLCL